MKPFTQLLSGLLVASLALLNSGAAWSDTHPNKSQAKSSAKATHKKAKKSSHKAKPVAKAPGSTARPATTAMNPYLPGATAPIVAKPNPYLPGAAAATAGAPKPYLAAAVPIAAATPLALTKSLSLAAVAATPPVVDKATTPAPATTPRVDATAAHAPAVPVPAPVAVATTPVRAAAVTAAPAPVVAQAPQKAASAAKPAGNPYLVNSVAFNQTGTIFSPTESLGQLFGDFKLALPSLPTSDQSILPTIKKVQPTGEKPLYVLTFKCPTELVGIVPPPTKALHWLVTTGMDGINSTNLLPFNMQQVCQ